MIPQKSLVKIWNLSAVSTVHCVRKSSHQNDLKTLPQLPKEGMNDSWIVAINIRGGFMQSVFINSRVDFKYFKIKRSTSGTINEDIFYE